MKRVLALFGENEEILDQQHLAWKGEKLLLVTWEFRMQFLGNKNASFKFHPVYTGDSDKVEIEKRFANLIKWMELSS